MSQYIVPIQTQDADIKITLGFDPSLREVFWNVMDNGQDQGTVLASSMAGESLSTYLKDEHGVELSSLFEALPGIEKMLEEDEVYIELRREMSDSEIAGIGCAVVNPNRVIAFDQITLESTARHRG